MKAIENDVRSRLPTKIDNENLRASIEKNTSQTTRQVAKKLKVDHTTVSRLLKDIGKVKKLDTWVPHDFDSNEQN